MPPHERVVIIVQRGWAPRNFMDRTLLPPVQTSAGVVNIEGRLEAPPSKLMELEAKPSAAADGQTLMSKSRASDRMQTLPSGRSKAVCRCWG